MYALVMIHKVVFIRHGESEWNKLNLFSGWKDTPLTEQGKIESLYAAKVLKENGYSFDVGYSSVLERSIETLWIILEELNLSWIPTFKSWKLNERHYGALTGLNKKETTKKEGEARVFIWRRSFKTRPPAMDPKDEKNPKFDPKYKDVKPGLLPLTESLEDASKRIIEYWGEEIEKRVKQGERVLVSCHGSTLRALIKHFENLSDEEITQINVPYAVPLVFEFDDRMKFIRKYYLGDEEQINKLIKQIEQQHTLSH